MPPPRKQRNAGPVPANRRFFLGARPAFDLPLCGNRVRNLLEVFREDQPDGPSRRISAERPLVVLSNAPFEIGACRSDVKASVYTAENV